MGDLIYRYAMVFDESNKPTRINIRIESVPIVKETAQYIVCRTSIGSIKRIYKGKLDVLRNFDAMWSLRSDATADFVKLICERYEKKAQNLKKELDDINSVVAAAKSNNYAIVGEVRAI